MSMGPIINCSALINGKWPHYKMMVTRLINMLSLTVQSDFIVHGAILKIFYLLKSDAVHVSMGSHEQNAAF